MHEMISFETAVGWIPPEMSEEAARWLVSQVPDPILLNLARLVRDDPETRGACSGFRLNAVALKNRSVKKRLCNRMASLMVAHPRIRIAFFLCSFPAGRWFRWSEVLDALDLEWLLWYWRDLIRATGDPAIAVAMALDEREELVERGGRLLLGTSLWEESGYRPSKEADLPEAWKILVELVGHGEACGKETPGRIAEDGLASRLEALEAEKGRLERENKRLRADIDGKGREISQLQGLLDKKREEARCLRKELLAERSRVQELSSGIDDRVRKELGRLYDELAGARDLQDRLWLEALEGPAEELSARVQRAIRAQRALDARYGTRSSARAVVRLLEERLREVEEVLSDALHPSRHLVSIRERLLHEIGEWEEVLEGRRVVHDPLAAAVLMQAQALASGEGGSSRVKGLLSSLDTPLGRLIPEEERTLLKERLSSLLEEGAWMEQDMPAAGQLPGVPEFHRPREIPSLSAFVARNPGLCARSVLVVDGYNAMKSSRAWQEEERKGFARARGRFCDLWEKKARDWREVELVFDGQEEMTSVEERGNLQVVFTDARQASQKADIYIQERLEELKKAEPGTRLFLVTADRKLRQAVSEVCDFFVEPRWALIQYLALED